jgi:hypothetical protein
MLCWLNRTLSKLPRKKRTKCSCLVDLAAQFVGVGLDPSLSLFLLVTVTGEKGKDSSYVGLFPFSGL